MLEVSSELGRGESFCRLFSAAATGVVPVSRSDLPATGQIPLNVRKCKPVVQARLGMKCANGNVCWNRKMACWPVLVIRCGVASGPLRRIAAAGARCLAARQYQAAGIASKLICRLSRKMPRRVAAGRCALLESSDFVSAEKSCAKALELGYCP